VLGDELPAETVQPTRGCTLESWKKTFYRRHKHYCCNLSGGVALIVWFTTNGMCVKNKSIIHVARASNRKRDCEHDLYCCLLPWCEAFRTWRSGFLIATLPSRFESDPVLFLNPIQSWSAKFLKIISLIQSWSASVKSCIFILPHEAKELLQLFCL